ncbi:undecaprenyl-phosphate glucose phosphotransferase [Azospirillum sp. RWY-5-1]|uniref:Undecaprenyl-phosphate glucose phosphotransferase n=1 Tax=Azospirillum oleiclasticum TaxID=2735135 RepID=A0ABX2TLS0_9PROT|nr:undecaprenyl-phosphate glucose phosphotransferase [Azospirillum oleiclasticum]NYZ16626.1 undecaprenyl-phosphate glucose phosphotransferase [Azospirillum oleiclasticum]NYZ24113.1 undecaprenyl-phosphate glucose phosphotransferase [Azospirillum oleiclasticum]
MHYAFIEGPSSEALHRPAVPALGVPLLGGLVAFGEFTILVATALTAYAIYLEGILDAPQLHRYAAVAVIGSALIVAANSWAGLYQPRAMLSLKAQLPRLLGSVSTAALIIVGFGFLLQISSQYSRGWAALWFMASIGSVVAYRVLLTGWLRQQAAAGRFRRHVVVVGTGEEAGRFLARVGGQGAGDLSVSGVFAQGAGPLSGVVGGHPVLGALEDLWLHVRDNPVTDIVLALPWSDEERLRAAIHQVSMLPVDVHILLGAVPQLQSRLMLTQTAGTAVSSMAGTLMLEVAHRPLKGWNAVVKRAEDLVLVGLLLAVFGPLMLLIALAVRLDSPGPAIFRQQRFGFNNRPFEIWKFRTMHVDRGDASGARRTVRGDDRVTRIGRFLRRSSLDELPQLINVLRGEMSMVGPRAHPVSMKAGNALYHEAVSGYIARHRVRPGITGLAQVSGCRGEIDTLEKARRRVDFDLQYIAGFSIWLDLEILARTFVCLLRDDSAY